MRIVLAGLAAAAAAIVLPAAPAQAQFAAGSDGHSAHKRAPVFVDDGFRCDFRSSGRIGRRGEQDRRGRRDSRQFCDVIVPGWYGGEWALYNNRSWEPDSFNGWWHDRPDRAYPRWMQNNQNCERIWWGGGGWRC